MAFFAVAGLRVQRSALASGGQRKLALPDGGCDPTDAAGARTERRWTPEVRLRFAVLVRALIDQRRYGAAVGPAAAISLSAARWIASDDLTWPLSFVNCCEALDLEPAAVRARLAAELPRPVIQAAGRRRRAA